MSHPAGRILATLGVVLLVLVGMLLLWAVRAGGLAGLGQLFTTGAIHQLQPALFQSAPLRTGKGGADRVYLLSSQSESVIGMGSYRRGGNRPRRDYLHVDLWAIDASNATLAWRKRLRTYEGAERAGRDPGSSPGQRLRGFNLLGVDGKTLWLTIDGPLGVSLADGSVVADGARIDSRNPALAGRRVDETGYIAFGRHGLQLTLNDASQWRIDASDLGAAPRDTPVRDPRGIQPPARTARGSSTAFVTRALVIGERWLGVMTEQESRLYTNKPVIPGRDPGERPGAMQQYLEANHVPAPLHELQAQPYRLWAARVRQVSAAPPDWPKHFPDTWGKRPQFSDYQLLPEAPPLLRAGLLHNGDPREQALWYRQPDSVLVLHRDKLGSEGRLQLSRISGPAGKPVWSTTLPLDDLQAVMPNDQDLLLLGSEPATANGGAGGGGPQVKAVRVEVASGRIATLDLTAESMKQPR